MLKLILLILGSVLLMILSPITTPFVLILLSWIFLKLFIYSRQYNQSVYKKLVNLPLFKVIFDKGVYGEFLTVKALEGLSKNERFLVNVYLVKASKKNETTEIDVIYINESGIFVFESKNYSGWIFGNEKSRYWTQMLNSRTKNKFYNPIFQNAGHISALKAFLGNEFDEYYKNVIVFSERCQLKNITLESQDVYVIKRTDLRSTIQKLSKESVLTAEQIHTISERLMNFTNVTEEIKQNHIANIHANNQDLIIENKEVSSTNEAEEKICDRCGAPMLLRTAQRGENKGTQFFGCSSFPKCRNMIQNN